ncbi:MAG TPA: phenazine biosynthesis FMN-dependent oxidase PhzG [Thermomonospora sp.]|nr:phenazine biosynthesis FMN-dependent oxidase PhzG [Thermomonospora sp.]
MKTASSFESLTGTVDLPFPEYDDPPPAPAGLLHDWLAAAVEQGVREPKALALATADRRGRPSTRIVAINRVTEEGGLVFATHEGSRKARELAETGWASGLLYWRESARQISVSGPVRRLGDAECDALWFSRARPMHSMSAAARQSEPLEDVDALRAEALRLDAVDGPLPRPERYIGFVVELDGVEFWSAASDRLHRRLRYDRDGDGWRITRLQP